VVHVLREAGVVAANGRILPDPPILRDLIGIDRHGSRMVTLTEDGDLSLTQWDIRELQKAKGAIRAAMDTLMAKLELSPQDLKRIILTGSFGGQIEIQSAISLGMIPPVPVDRVETIANGAGFGAAMFLTDEGFAHAETLAEQAEQVDLDQEAHFISRYVGAMALSPEINEINLS
jgi:uncharacterized 2Fe-2S/4Fe-4S cluster protein (DUF4445 family)